MTTSPKPRSVLVTGGSGTLGRELVARYARMPDASVTVLARGTAPTPSGSHVRFLTGDIRAGVTLGLSSGAYDEIRAGVTDIIHCAADTTFNRPLEEARATNVGGTRAVLAFAGECPRLARVP